MLKEVLTQKLKYKRVTENNSGGNDANRENGISKDPKWRLGGGGLS